MDADAEPAAEVPAQSAAQREPVLPLAAAVDLLDPELVQVLEGELRGRFREVIRWKPKTPAATGGEGAAGPAAQPVPEDSEAAQLRALEDEAREADV